MKELAEPAAYLSDETGYWRRMPWALGAFMSVLGTLNIWITNGEALQPWEIIARGLGGGVVFGVVVTVLFRIWVRWMIRRGFGRPAPEGVQYRLVCSILKSPRMTVPGALLFSRDVVFFVPAAAGALGREVQLPLAMLGVSSEPLRRGWLMRLMAARDPVAMRLTTSAQSESFIVPTPEVTIRRVGDVVAEMGKTLHGDEAGGSKSDEAGGARGERLQSWPAASRRASQVTGSVQGRGNGPPDVDAG